MTVPFAPSQTTAGRYRPEIDGLRAVAVLAVLLYHAHVPGFGGGFVGVDVFFVISGYLITTIIRREEAQSAFSYRRFYEHRIRRIVPALALALAASAVAAAIILLPGDLEQFGRALAAAALFFSNIFFWRSLNYFSQPAEFMPLLHTWSLAIEEQFYILFPPIMLFLLRRSQNAGRIVITALSLLSLGLCVMARTSPVAAFFLTPMRAWELGVGAMLALDVIPPVRTALARQFLSALSLAAIAAVIVGLNPQSLFPWPWALLPAIATMLFLHAAGRGDTVAVRLLSLPPAVGVGLMSYPLYLWHWPMLAFARYVAGPLNWPLAGAALALSFAAAFLSWRFVERPFRSRQPWLAQKQVFAVGAAALVLLGAAGGAMLAGRGLPNRFPPRVQAMDRQLHTDVTQLYRAGSCFLTTGQDALAYDVDHCFAPPGGVLLWGDSHAAHLWPGLKQILPFAGEASSTGCPPIPSLVLHDLPHCADFNRLVQKLVLQRHTAVVVLSAHWLLNRTDDAGIDRMLDWLKSHHIPAVLVGPNVEFDSPLSQILARHMIYGTQAPIRFREAIATAFARDAQMRAHYANRHGVTYVSILGQLCRGGYCPAMLPEGAPITWDESHLSEAGSLLVARQVLMPALAPYLRP